MFRFPSLILWYVTAIYIRVSYCSLLEREESPVSSILQIGYDRVSRLFVKPIKIIAAIIVSFQRNKSTAFGLHFILCSATRRAAAWDPASASCWCWKTANCSPASVCVWPKRRWRWPPSREVGQWTEWYSIMGPSDWPFTMISCYSVLRRIGDGDGRPFQHPLHQPGRGAFAGLCGRRDRRQEYDRAVPMRRRQQPLRHQRRGPARPDQQDQRVGGQLLRPSENRRLGAALHAHDCRSLQQSRVSLSIDSFFIWSATDVTHHWAVFVTSPFCSW